MPIKSKIFNTDQIRAIQEGRMTQFMQVVKPQPWPGTGAGFAWSPKGTESDSSLWNTNMQSLCNHMAERCPFGKVGDVVYCRENWAVSCSGQFAYMADGGLPPKIIHETANECGGEDDITWCWFPSATMPREAARLFLRITNIRVMRVQELAYADRQKQYDKKGELPPSYELHKNNPYVWIIDFAKTDKP